MSRPMREQLTCPKYGHEDEVTIWSSLNNMLSPDAANELLFGNLFGHTCPECGNTTELCHACLYHDMEEHVMVQYVPDESQAEATVAHLDGTSLSTRWTRLVTGTGSCPTTTGCVRRRASSTTGLTTG